MDTSHNSVIERIDTSHNKLIRLYRSVPITSLLEPYFLNGWSVKDILTHIAAWEWRCAGMLQQAHETNMPFQGSPDVDALNEEIYLERKEWNWEDVDGDFREAHQEVIEAIKALSPHRLEDPAVIRHIAVNTWEHYDEHLSALELWHQQVIRGR